MAYFLDWPPITQPECPVAKSKKTWCMGPHAGVDYNLTLCRLQSRLQHMYHGQTYARVDLKRYTRLRIFLSPILEFA
jgi:hypothetical protein